MLTERGCKVGLLDQYNNIVCHERSSAVERLSGPGQAVTRYDDTMIYIGDLLIYSYRPDTSQSVTRARNTNVDVAVSIFIICYDLKYETI